MDLNAHIPEGPLADKWTNHKFRMNLVNPANKRKYRVIVVGTGLAGAAAAEGVAAVGAAASSAATGGCSTGSTPARSTAPGSGFAARDVEPEQPIGSQFGQTGEQIAN